MNSHLCMTMQLRVGETVKRRAPGSSNPRHLGQYFALPGRLGGVLSVDSARNALFLTFVRRRRRRIGFNAWFTNG